MCWTHRIRVLCIAAPSVAALSGCGAIIRSSIDTQPRVRVAPSAVDRPGDIVNGHAVAYMPGPIVDGCDDDLARYSPVIIQGFQVDPDHTGDDNLSDAIGLPVCNADGNSIRIDTSTPTLFGRVEHASVYGTTLKQLTYVYWYPRREVGAIETGTVDGGILRITLDAGGNPSIFEFSQTCGCYHGVFAAARTEQHAQAEFGAPLDSRKHSLESASRENEWIVRDVIDARAGQQPVLYVSAGEHFCEMLRFIDRGETLHAAEKRTYMLDQYDRLDAIASDAGGTASMFNEQRLVRGAKRWKEELVFSNIKHPGWPRHLDAMLVHWDHDRWNDPTLLERNLRMPHETTVAHAGSDSAPLSTNATDDR